MWSSEESILQLYKLKLDPLDDLFEIIASLSSEGKNSPKEILHKVSELEIENENYFMLFRVEQYIPTDKDTPFTSLEIDLKNLKNGKKPPSLRDIYAVSEYLQRPRILLTLPLGSITFKGLYIRPVLRIEQDANPLILVLKFSNGDPFFKRVVPGEDEDINIKNCPFEIHNENHKQCLHYDQRFRNNFRILEVKNSIAEHEAYDSQDIFDIISTFVYGGNVSPDFVRDCIKHHMDNESLSEVYAKFFEPTKDSEEENELHKAQHIKNEVKRENAIFKLRRKLLSRHLKERKPTTCTKGDAFAISSLYNIPLYIYEDDKLNSSGLFYPITSSYAFIFDSPLYLDKRNNAFYLKLHDEECSCQVEKPRVPGHFPVIQEKVEKRIETLVDIYPCCPEKKRHGPHRHFSSINRDKTDLPEIISYPRPLYTEIEQVIDHLTYQGLRIDQINHGAGTLEQCLSKEIYGSEGHVLDLQNLVGHSTTNEPYQDYLQSVADIIHIPIFVLEYTRGNMHWISVSPNVTPSTEKTRCRYFTSLLHMKTNFVDSFDRIVPLAGCNCKRYSPDAEAYKKNEETPKYTGKVRQTSRHRPLITFFYDEPKGDCFVDEIRRTPLSSTYSEIPVLLSRSDMEERTIDCVSDYSFSLFRCISKEIFGGEEEFVRVRDEVVSEIKRHPSIYGRFMRDGRKGLSAEEKKENSEYLENFRFRKEKFSDKFKRNSSIEKEEAEFYAKRIEDGLELEDLELIAAATCFQTPIYVLSLLPRENKCENIKQADMSKTERVKRDKEDREKERWTCWTLFEKFRTKRRPKNLNERKFQCRCATDENGHSRYYIMVYRNFAGHFHRIVPKNDVCNCLTFPPNVPEKILMDVSRKDMNIFHDMRRFENAMVIAREEFDSFFRSSQAFELLCEEIIKVLEGRRKDVNIAGIVGSSVGLAGAILAVVGIAVAPVTAGASLGLTIAGGVIGGLGGITTTGSKLTEVGLNQKPYDQIDRYQMNMKERARCLRKSILALQMELDQIMEKDLDSMDAISAENAVRVLRSLSGLMAVPIAILRALSRAVLIAEVIVVPLSFVFDSGILVFSAHNLAKGSHTTVTNQLRSLKSLLKAIRIQMFISAYGNQRSLPDLNKLATAIAS